MAKIPKSDVDTFLDRCKAVAKKRGLKLSTLSLYIMNDGAVLPRLEEDSTKDIGTRKREAAEIELAKVGRGKPTIYQEAQGLSGKAAQRATAG